MTWFGNQMYDRVIKEPLKKDNNKTLYAITGYASGSFVQHVIETYKNVNLNLIIGMARRNGILRSDHDTYINLMERYSNRFYGYYYAGSQSVHAKAYAWQSGKSVEGMIGSANFTNNGMRHNYEVMQATQQSGLIVNTFNDLLKASVKIDELIDDVQIIDVQPNHPEIVASLHGSMPYYSEEITLSLLTGREQIHERSGLNWGQRPDREPNQAYIPVPRSVHRNHPNFLPDRGEHFTVVTDDGENFVCTVAQQNNKAIETPHNNSLLGMYFRRRIGVPLGEFVNLIDLQNYGRTNILLRKLDDDMFYLDFSVQ